MTPLPDVQSVQFEVTGNYGVMRFNRPDSLNSLNSTVLKDMRAVIRYVADADEIRALMITGNGRAFCSGADLKGGRSSGKGRQNRPEPKPTEPGEDTPTRGQRMTRTMVKYANPVIADMLALDKPIVAAVNGVAAGAGVGIALSCDMVVAARSATFIQVFGPQLGVVPDMGCTWLLPRLIGRAQALGLMLTGERLSAEDAVEAGLIWRCVDDERLMDEADSLTSTLASGPTKTFGLIKKAVRAADRNSLEQQLELEATYQGYCVDTDDAIEGVVAFAQKRKPVFKGK